MLDGVLAGRVGGEEVGGEAGVHGRQVVADSPVDALDDRDLVGAGRRHAVHQVLVLEEGLRGRRRARGPRVKASGRGEVGVVGEKEGGGVNGHAAPTAGRRVVVHVGAHVDLQVAPRRESLHTKHSHGQQIASEV